MGAGVSSTIATRKESLAQSEAAPSERICDGVICLSTKKSTEGIAN